MQSKYNGSENFEHYVNSPKQSQKAPTLFQVSIPTQHLRSPDILATQTCTEVDLVASSLQNPPVYCDMTLASCSKQTTFYAPLSTMIKEESKKEAERAQPDGEELRIHEDIPKKEVQPVSIVSKSELSVIPSTSNLEVPNDQNAEQKSKNCDDLDEVMHQISSDLDYLLNGDSELDILTEKQKETRHMLNTIELTEKPTNKTNSLRRLSKANLSIEKIDEEDEEEADTEVVIKGILRTKC